ncbi:Gp19/Gp15/Gp42 family protein [Auritidibacter ignavus]|uniref:Gp19/Gp15/Gp42 family protein n=1 Tax=Auritidibacter ignavus TaxID=678932 RepID=A0AAJ6ALG8_9MICC|nr:Gp19/Gp15/Gp42 family protein [Auritidibacter ignavus]WGH92096.1 Gp19/Gp15/Gp42 family protein [Auritidibacter ignavus]
MIITDEELPAVEMLIQRAEAKLIARVPRLVQRVESGVLPESTVQTVVEDMVLRAVRNPEGVASESVGGVSTSYRRSAASGVVEVLKEDLVDLMPEPSKVRRHSMSVPRWRVP